MHSITLKCIQLHQNVFRNKLALITYIILGFDHCANRLTPFNIRKKSGIVSLLEFRMFQRPSEEVYKGRNISKGMQ